MLTMPVKRTAFWYPVANTQAEFNNLPEFWQDGVTLDTLPVWRSKQLEDMEGWAEKHGVELTIVRTTPSYMRAMLGHKPDTAAAIIKTCMLIAALPDFDADHIYGEDE